MDVVGRPLRHQLHRSLDSSFQNKSFPETGETVLLGDDHFQYGWNGESGRYIVEDYINVF